MSQATAAARCSRSPRSSAPGSIRCSFNGSASISAARRRYASRSSTQSSSRSASTNQLRCSAPAAWNTPGYICTYFDGQLQQALQESMRPVQVINSLRSTVAPEPGVALLVHLRGHWSDPNSLVLTEEQHNDLFDCLVELPTCLAKLVRGSVGRSPLFLGLDPRDPLVRRLISKILPEQHRDTVGPIYFACVNPSDDDKAYWSDFETEWLDLPSGRPHDGHQHRASAGGLWMSPSSRHHPRTRWSARRLRASPISSSTFSRNATGRALPAVTATSRSAWIGLPHSAFSFCTARSGHGKTSLLKAGLFPRLREQGLRPVYIRTLKDPVGDLQSALLAEAGPAPSPSLDGEGRETSAEAGPAPSPSLDGNGDGTNPAPGRASDDHDLEKLVHGLPSTGRIVLVLDQFEEFFILFRDQRKIRAEFVETIRKLIMESSLEIHLVFKSARGLPGRA